MEKEKFDIKRLAKLARLRFDENELPAFERDMKKIVREVENLPDFPDTALPLDPADAMPLRSDVPGKSLTRAQVLKNAPKVEAGCVVVPKVVEE